MIAKVASRRMFLRGTGGAVLALPFLQSLASREALAVAAPRRFIAIKSYSTQIITDWYPTWQGNGYQLKDAVYKGTTKADGTTLLTKPVVPGSPYMAAPLTDFQDAGVSHILDKSLNKFLPRMNLIRGLDFLPSTNHNYGGMLGNYASCDENTPDAANTLPMVPTIDQVLGYSKTFYPTAPAVRTLLVTQGVTNASSYTDLGVAGGAVKQMQARANPLEAFNDIFGMAGGQPGGTDPTRPSRDALVVDRVYQDYVKLKQNSRLSGGDRALVDQYMTLMSELQGKLKATQGLSCAKPADPASAPNNQGTDATEIKSRWSLFLDLVVAALMCDRTRCVVIDARKALGPGPDPASAAQQGYYHYGVAGGSWHGLAHDWANPNSRRMLAGINNWIAKELFLNVLTRLDLPEAGGSTYLDNSLVYWGNELGFNHINYSVPCLLAGGAGGAIKTGRYIDYIDWTQRAYFAQEDGNVIRGLPHNRLMVSILQAMGLSPAEYQRGGLTGYGQRDPVGKPPNLWPIDYDFTSIASPLPGFLT